MNFKNTAIGLFAGSALALSLAGGAVAQGALTELELASADDCGASVAVAEGGEIIDFGTLDWELFGGVGTYVGTPTGGEITVSVANLVFPDDSCSVSLTVSNLVGTEEEEEIPAGSITVDPSPVTGVTPSTTVDATVTFNSGYSADGFNIDNVSPDIYTGTIIVSEDLG